MLTSYCRDPRLIPDQSMWNLWWTKWHWDKFLLENCFPVSNIPPMLQTHISFIHIQCYMAFAVYSIIPQNTAPPPLLYLCNRESSDSRGQSGHHSSGTSHSTSTGNKPQKPYLQCHFGSYIMPQQIVHLKLFSENFKRSQKKFCIVIHI
jgi:hypothetical protein